jgi:hypothetical protein
MTPLQNYVRSNIALEGAAGASHKVQTVGGHINDPCTVDQAVTHAPRAVESNGPPFQVTYLPLLPPQVVPNPIQGRSWGLFQQRVFTIPGLQDYISVERIGQLVVNGQCCVICGTSKRFSRPSSLFAQSRMKDHIEPFRAAAVNPATLRAYEAKSTAPSIFLCSKSRPVWTTPLAMVIRQLLETCACRHYRHRRTHAVLQRTMSSRST